MSHPNLGLLHENYFRAFGAMTHILKNGPEALIVSERNRKLYEKAFADIIRRLDYSLYALSLKYSFSEDSFSKAHIRIAPSGFPHCAEITDMIVELVESNRSQQSLVSVEMLKQAWLIEAFEQGKDDPHLLWRIAERRYIALLDSEKIMMQVVANAAFEHYGQNRSTENEYAFWWLCYDDAAHVPCIYLLEFTQDIREGILPLHENIQDQAEFLQVIRTRGNRAASVSVVASDIDLAIPHVHPHRLTRLQLDLFLTDDLKEVVNGEMDVEALEALHLLDTYGKPTDFILCFSRDIAESKGRVKSGMFSGRTLEVYNLDEGNVDAYNRGATDTSRFVLLSHTLWQNIVAEGLKQDTAIFAGTERRFVYWNEENGGTINAI